MGESRDQRAGLIAQLANLNPYPESVPINHLVQVEGTPLHGLPPLDPFEFVRTIAVARITMPKARVRLSAGRRELGEAVQAMCFMAGANSIFYGDKLLTTDNPEANDDRALLEKLGLRRAARYWNRYKKRRCSSHTKRHHKKTSGHKPQRETMFTKILIANRGEIACRVAATARRMGIKTVAVYSEADANAKHVAVCDEAVLIGPAAAKESYLCGDKIIAVAKATGAQAIHPGYGFLSENAEFADACAEAGLVFIGPPASAMRAMGSKSAAKQLMEKANVPLVPGYHGEQQDADFLHTQADRIGYPVLLKASAGGGGKGMRVIENSAQFKDALASCKREAISSLVTTRCWRRNTSSVRVISKFRCLPIRSATASICSSAIARCSAVTRRCWKKRRRRA
jgi:hypothetical protein